jgi:serine/threonine protein kinase/TPR repeat protein
MAEAEHYQHYEVLRREDGSLWELGRGAMGITYKAFDTSLRCPVALKVINNSYLDSEVARQRFLREARAAASLRHQNVASVFHLGTDHESYFYAMEFIDGETVDAYISRWGLLDPAEALGLTLQVSRALAAADKENLVHRDLKPSNLMLVDEDDEKVVKVIDFGLAKSTQRGGESSGTLTIGGGFVGTPHFASPEQLEERDIDIRSDIYSLGATLYYMLAGRPPYSGSVAQIMSQHLYKPIPREPLDGVPPCVVELIERMMEKDPAKRPQRPSDLRREILPCLGRLQASVTGGSAASAIANAGEQPDTLRTLDLSTIRPGAEGPGTLLAQRYSIISYLGDALHGRRFLADDRRRARQVSVLLFSPEFLSEGKRYAAFEQEIDRLQRAPNPLLRQVYSLEGAAHQRFLVEEYVFGPSLLEILRARSFLSPPEAWLLLNLLAPVADHARFNELQQVDFTLSGVQLISPRLTQTRTEADVIRRPLTRWDQLDVKVAALDFSLASSDPTTWGGAATLTQRVSGAGTRASYLRMLSLLVYELLGGPRNSVESTGRYSPIASLSERGNALLRRGFVDDFRSATEMALQLGGEIVARNIDPVTTMLVSASSPGSSPANMQSGTAIPPSQPVLPIEDAGQTPSAISSNREKTRNSAVRFIPVLVLVLGIGLGGYLLSQHFLGGPGAKKEQPTTLPGKTLAQTSTPPMAQAIAAPRREPLASPTVEASATPSQEAPAIASAEGSVMPSREALASASAENSAAPSPEAVPSPGVEASATPSRQAPVSPSADASATPSREALATPSAGGSATPSREALATPSAEASATPSREEALATPSARGSATPSREAHPGLSPEAVAMARLEPNATPDSRVAGSQSQAMKTSSDVDNYPDKLAAAQRLIDSSDWPGALKAHLELIERYPERPAASRSLENLLTDWSIKERKPDSESFAQMKPDLVRAAEDGILQAMLIMARSSLETDRGIALKWYQAAAAKGSVEGMKKAGDLLYSNRRRPDDDQKALDYFVQAASSGDTEAEYLAGECYFFGKGTRPDIDKAAQFLQQAAARGYTKAMDLLGTCYRKQGKFEQARRSYEEAAATGYALSFYNLGVLYMNGEGVSRSPKKAEDQFRRSAELSKQYAEKGDLISMFYYANWLEQGIGVAKDAKAASEWFRRSASAGYPPAIDWCKRNGVVP